MALAYLKQVDEKTAFGIWKIEETAEDLYSRLQLKAKETAFTDGLNKGKRYLHWLSTRVLLRQMLNTNEYIDCEADEHGKPYLLNFPHKISLSHSFDYAAVMVSEDKPVGIDIEFMKRKVERIAHKFLVDEELEFIDPAHRVEHLYVSWCAKEAVYKLQGKRNVSFRENIRLQPFELKKEGKFEAILNTESDHQLFEVHYEAFDGYMIGYAAGYKNI